jgi:hypothetical protein
VRLDADGELVVAVATGARLRGLVEPAEAVAELRRLAGSPDPHEPENEYRARICLRAGATTVPPLRMRGNDTPEFERFLVAPDGSFDVAGLPPGTWDVTLMYWERSASMGRSHQLPLGTHVLADGADVEVRADLTSLLPGTVRGLVLADGVPVANAHCAVDERREGSDVWPTATMFETDAEGRFELTTRPGTYRLRCTSRAGIATPLLVVARGQVVEQTFTFAVGTLQVRLLTATGEPAADVGIHVNHRGGVKARTRADGIATLTLHPDTFTLWVLPRRWRAEEKRGPGFLHGGNAPATSEWHDLGSATVFDGRTTVVELRLPPDWE